MSSPGFSTNILGYIIEWVYDQLDIEEMLQNKKYLHKTWDDTIKQVNDVIKLVTNKNDVRIKSFYTDDNTDMIECNTYGNYRLMDVYYNNTDMLMGSLYIITIYST